MKPGHKRTVIEREIAATDRQIDEFVYELYGLTDREVRVARGADEARDGGGTTVVRCSEWHTVSRLDSETSCNVVSTHPLARCPRRFTRRAFAPARCRILPCPGVRG